MLLNIITPKGEKTGSIKLPSQFSEPIRTDLIQRAVDTYWDSQRQPYGADPEAGKKQITWMSKRRRDYKATYGKGQSRVPRKTLAHRGTWFHHVAAFAPGTVGGRGAHPPTAKKLFGKKLNTQERRKALRSALAATLSKELVTRRGHHLPPTYPFILSTETETLGKTADLVTTLHTLGFEQELARSATRSIRAGRGKSRGRPYKTATSLLLVTGTPCALTKSARNIPGVDAVDIHHLNAHLLAPGNQPGRATLYTQHAIEEIAQKRLFL